MMWSARPPITLADVQYALHQPLPGYAAQERMATRPRTVTQGPAADVPPLPSAVLLALFERDGALWLPLTVRSNTVQHHRGQISLPGGAREPGDADAWENAVREAVEELGLDRRELRPLGALTPLFIPSSRFLVYPWVGLLAAAPTYTLDCREVAEVIELPLDVLRDPACKGLEQWTLHGLPTQVPFYRYRDHVIWGATAMLLGELEALLANSAG